MYSHVRCTNNDRKVITVILKLSLCIHGTCVWVRVCVGVTGSHLTATQIVPFLCKVTAGSYTREPTKTKVTAKALAPG